MIFNTLIGDVVIDIDIPLQNGSENPEGGMKYEYISTYSPENFEARAGGATNVAKVFAQATSAERALDFFYILGDATPSVPHKDIVFADSPLHEACQKLVTKELEQAKKVNTYCEVIPVVNQQFHPSVKLRYIDKNKIPPSNIALRFDLEGNDYEGLATHSAYNLDHLFSTSRVNAISDYGKGTLSSILQKHNKASLLECATPECYNPNNIGRAKETYGWLIADPKPTCSFDLEVYRGFDLLKVNEKEALRMCDASGRGKIENHFSTLFSLLSRYQITSFLVTRGEQSAIFVHSGNLQWMPLPSIPKAPQRLVGAGDIVMGYLMAYLANGTINKDITILIDACHYALEQATHWVKGKR